MDYINYDSDEDSCIVEDVDLEECDKRQETDLPPVNDLEFIASMAADFTYDYGSIVPATVAPAPLPLSTPMEDGDSSDDDCSSDESVTAAPAVVADHQSSSDNDSSDSEEEVTVTKKGYKKESKQISWLTEEEEEGSSGPLKTKNEIDEPIEAVNPDLLTIADTSTLTCIGQVMYRIDHECVVVIQADFTSSPLNEGSLLCNVDGKVLGKVQEIFGPITTPYYTVKWRNTPSAGAGEKGKNAQAGGGKNAKNNRNKKGGKKGQAELAAAEETSEVCADAEPEVTATANIAEEAEGMEVVAQEIEEQAPATADPAVNNADTTTLPAGETTSAEAAAVAAAPTPSVPPPSSALAIADVRALFPVGAKLFSAPAHCTYVLAGQLQKLYGRGSDASNAYDEEVSVDGMVLVYVVVCV
jgi:rRNA processing protein Gar1